MASKPQLPDLTRVQMAILATLTDQEERYGLDIVRTLKAKGQPISLATLYTSLMRMEADGLVTSRWGDEASAVRQGARRRYYALTGLGERALQQATTVVLRVLRAVPNVAHAAEVPA
jgi:PadR family transcriptional regulator PadR